MKYILDTNICIYIIKHKPPQVFEKFSNLKPGSVGISIITFSELQYGVRKSSQPEKNQLALNQFLIPLDIFEFGLDSGIEYGRIRANLKMMGTPIGPLDTLIAAHAKGLNLILVTNNEREFQRVNGLEISNWLKD